MKRTIAIGLITAGASAAGIVPAAATSPHTGCPPPSSGYVVWNVDQVPYQVDNLVDNKGNGNGTVCAKPVDGQTFVLDGQTYQVYNFIDDVVAS